MTLRVLGSLVIVALFGLNWMLPRTDLGRRGASSEIRQDVTVAGISVGARLPHATLMDLAGEPVSLSELRGQRLLLVFERSVDWCPFTKMRLLELKQTFEEVPDLQIVWVMAEQQMSERTRRLIDEFGLRSRIRFLTDDQSMVIRDLGLLKPEPTVIEEGVPHPTTLLLDRQGIVRFIDVREDYHHWLDTTVLSAALDAIE